VFGGHSDLPPRLRLKWNLLGFPRIEHPIGIKIDEIAIVRDKRGALATLPAQPVLDRPGRQKRDINDKPQYAAILERRDRGLSGPFLMRSCARPSGTPGRAGQHVVRSRDLNFEMRAALTEADVCELQQYGISPAVIASLVGIARVNHIIDTGCYAPAWSGALAFITPVLVEDPVSPEARFQQLVRGEGGLWISWLGTHRRRGKGSCDHEQYAAVLAQELETRQDVLLRLGLAP